MSLKMLKSHEMKLLKEVVLKHRPSLLPLLDSLGRVSLTTKQREDLRGAIAEEFSQTGLGKNDEPNSRGRLLENLIDRLGHL